jgi:NAD-dependent deacetylase
MKKRLVVLTGAGMSAESGLKTFRDMGGLWHTHNVYEVASPEGWRKMPQTVLDFYNERRKQLLEAKPNDGHRLLAQLENDFSVRIVTQNIDDLHERAGSTNVLHLHGELRKAQSTCNQNLIYDIEGWQLNLGDTDENGCQLRPFVVWFGESVPMLNKAIDEMKQADLLLIIGTSLNVYPAAGLMTYTRSDIPIYYIDKQPAFVDKHIHIIKDTASSGLLRCIELLNLEK